MLHEYLLSLSIHELPKSLDRDYIDLVRQSVSSIKSGSLEKVVAATCANEPIPAGSIKTIAFQIVKRALDKYPNAFVSICYTPDYGLWLCATPELFIGSNHNGLTAFSLAGTQTQTSGDLGAKEKAEQETVTNYIKDVFDQFGLKPRLYQKEKIKAGNLTHILTKVGAKACNSNQLLKLLKEMHPTPAVGGFPKNSALDFIMRNEKLERGLFSGYLGPYHSPTDFKLYVNLRCAQVFQDGLRLYAGAGINAMSDPIKEWEEVKAKMRTIKDLIDLEN